MVISHVWRNCKDQELGIKVQKFKVTIFWTSYDSHNVHIFKNYEASS